MLTISAYSLRFALAETVSFTLTHDVNDVRSGFTGESVEFIDENPMFFLLQFLAKSP